MSTRWSEALGGRAVVDIETAARPRAVCAKIAVGDGVVAGSHGGARSIKEGVGGIVGRAIFVLRDALSSRFGVGRRKIRRRSRTTRQRRADNVILDAVTVLLRRIPTGMYMKFAEPLPVARIALLCFGSKPSPALICQVLVVIGNSFSASSSLGKDSSLCTC